MSSASEHVHPPLRLQHFVQKMHLHMQHMCKSTFWTCTSCRDARGVHGLHAHNLCTGRVHASQPRHGGAPAGQLRHGRTVNTGPLFKASIASKQLEAGYTLASFQQARLGACQDPIVSMFQNFPFFAFPEPYNTNYSRQLIK